MTRLLPDVGVKFIQNEEGLRLSAYQDQGGVWTIGYGHTGIDVHAGLVIDMAQAIALMRQDFDRSCNDVETRCPGSNDNEFSAMASLAFNIGDGPAGFPSSSVVRNWTAGNKHAAADSFELWNKSMINGVLQVNPVLVGRRAREKALFLTPVATTASVDPQSSVNTAQATMPQAVAPPPSPVTSKTVIATATAATATAASIADSVTPILTNADHVKTTATQAMSLLHGPYIPIALGVIVLGCLIFIGVRYVLKMRGGQVKST